MFFVAGQKPANKNSMTKTMKISTREKKIVEKKNKKESPKRNNTTVIIILSVSLEIN